MGAASFIYQSGVPILGSTWKGAGGGGAPSSFAYTASSVTGCVNGNLNETKCTYALHQTPGAGHLLTLGASWHDSGTVTAAITDPNNGTWTAIGSKKTGTGTLAAYSGQMFYVASAVNAATTVTLTLSGGNSGSSGQIISWEATEYSYTGTISSTDGAPTYSNTAASGGTASIDTTVTANASDLVWAACLAVDSACAVGSGYTGRNDSAGTCSANTGGTTCATTNNNFTTLTGGLMEDKVNVAAGTQTATFGTGTTDNVILGLVAF